jgi:hypothetical protein
MEGNYSFSNYLRSTTDSICLLTIQPSSELVVLSRILRILHEAKSLRMLPAYCRDAVSLQLTLDSADRMTATDTADVSALIRPPLRADTVSSQAENYRL